MQNKTDELTKKYWQDEVVKGNLMFPNEHVIRFARRNFRQGTEKLLDFGGGAGRDTLALASFGYDMTIVDYNESGLAICAQRAEKFGYKNIAYKVNQEDLHLDFPDDTFDGIIADGSVFCRTSLHEEILLMTELRRILKSGGAGKVWASWRTTEDTLCKNHLPGCIFLENEKRNGVNYFFADRETICTIYEKAGFSRLDIDYSQYTENNGKEFSKWWHVVGTK